MLVYPSTEASRASASPIWAISSLFHVANYRKYGVMLPPLGWNNGGGQYKAAMVVYDRVTIKGGF